jgi:phospholipase/lecithinase/hemolysin
MTRPVVWIISAVISMCAVFNPASGMAEQRVFDRIVVFGDSLSDTGNAAGARFSNGPVWVEHLADAFGLSVAPARSGGTNYAVGGARAWEPGSPHNLRAQADLYLESNPSEREARRTLYVVYGGGNDLLAAVYGHDPSVLAMGAVRSLGTIVDDLASRGATDILVPNLPDLARVPALRQFGPAIGRVATEATIGFNRALEVTLDGIESRSGARIHRLDVFALVERAVRDPGAVGLDRVNLTEPCVRDGSRCGDPDRHLFWDFVHPTALGHARLARAARDALNGAVQAGGL